MISLSGKLVISWRLSQNGVDLSNYTRGFFNLVYEQFDNLLVVG